MLPVTFYSYKGGVGRTMALLNVAAILANRGLEVAVLDLDLEAPGLGLSESTRRPDATTEGSLGASDFILDRIAGRIRPISDYGYEHELGGGRVFLIPAGQQASRLARLVSNFYEPGDDRSYAFPLLLAEIEHRRQPDVLLIDSRTGRADIAGVCAMDLPRVLVAVCGLNEQNINGLEAALKEMWAYHDEAERAVLTLLAASPVPRVDDLRGALGTRRESATQLRLLDEENLEYGLPSDHPLVRRLEQFRLRLSRSVTGERFARVQQHFPEVRLQDLIYGFEYDPLAPLRHEVIVEQRGVLFEAYERLADGLTRAMGQIPTQAGRRPLRDIETFMLRPISRRGA
jgi:hypothetical protein